jgi:hypothetical protein
MVVFKRRLWAANIACIVHRPFKEELKGLLANEINQEGLSWRNLDKIRPTNAYFWRWLWIAAEVVWWLSCSTRLHKQEGQQEGQLECPWRQQVESRTASRKPSQSMVSNREPRLSHDTWGNSLHSVLYLSNSCVHSFKYICLLRLWHGVYNPVGEIDMHTNDVNLEPLFSFLFSLPSAFSLENWNISSIG